jgi:uncharacterized protein
VLPVLPGTLLVLAGILLGGWADDFTRVGWGTVSILAGLAALAVLLDYVAALLGASKVGASRQALLGAAIGTVAGLVFGVVGVLFMPLVGAAIGEYLARRQRDQAVKVGLATGLGLLAGMLAKVVITCVMVGIFIAALIF